MQWCFVFCAGIRLVGWRMAAIAVLVCRLVREPKLLQTSQSLMQVKYAYIADQLSKAAFQHLVTLSSSNHSARCRPPCGTGAGVWGASGHGECVSVARPITLGDPFENMGAQLIEEV